MRRRLLPLVAAAFFFASAAHADAAGDADALISRGLELREKGKDEDALRLFREAQLKSPSPRARAQVALAEQALGLWVQAETDLGAALASDSDPWIAKNKSALDGALAVIRKHIASLEVRGSEKGDVYIDGVKLGTGAGPYRVEAGRRQLDVKASGYQTTSRAVDVVGGGIARETVTLVPTPAVQPAAMPTSGSPAATAKVEDSGHGQRIVGWVLLGAGAAFLATGGAGLFVRKSHVDDYNANSRCPGQNAPNQPADCQSQIDASHTWQTIGIVGLVGGAVAVAAGVVVLAVAPSSKANASIACTPFGCQGTF